MHRYLFLAALSLIGAGCASDMQLRMVDGDGAYVDSYRGLVGMSVESGGRQRVMVREANIDAEELTGRTSVLLYLSFPVQAGEGLDLRHPQLFLVWSDIAAEFSGFLNAQAFQQKQVRELQSLSGIFSGKMHSRSGELPPRDVTVTLIDVPLLPAESPAEIDRRIYSEMLREHLYRLESGTPDAEDSSAATLPGARESREDD